jgi:O-antigen ligase
VSGIFGNPNDLAMNMVTFLPAATVMALSPRLPASRRLLGALCMLLMFAVVVLTKSRGGVVGMVVMLATLVLLGARIRKGFRAVVIAAVLIATPLLPSSFWRRMETTFDEQKDWEYTGSRYTRQIVMMEGISTFLERPFTGVGAGQFRNYNPPKRQERWREAHNAIIQVAAETGIAGLLLFLFLIIRAAVDAIQSGRLLRRLRTRGRPELIRRIVSDSDWRLFTTHTVAMTAGLAGWFACALFASVAYSWTFYYLLALIVAGRELIRERVTAAEKAKAFSAIVPDPADPWRPAGSHGVSRAGFWTPRAAGARHPAC